MPTIHEEVEAMLRDHVKRGTDTKGLARKIEHHLRLKHAEVFTEALRSLILHGNNPDEQLY